MTRLPLILLVFGLYCLLVSDTVFAQEDAAQLVSEASQACLDCHATLHPGIVAGWEQSRHARVSPNAALTVEPIARRVSADAIPEGLGNVVVGCAECHVLNAEEHPDTYDHMGFAVHNVVTPVDCAVCHPVEAEQFDENVMAWAHENLAQNDLYVDLMHQINGTQTLVNGNLQLEAPNDETNADACYFCHGTVVEVVGTETRETILGEYEFPILSGWPNRGTGRINPDGSRGACSACHTRHRFSIEMAREPATCAECHKGPDVPAYKVYSVSKHGAIHKAHGSEWEMDAVPWTIGEDFTAPTCATCHLSLLVDTDGEIVAERTHAMKDRLDWRIFGLPYAHPQPVSPRTFEIVNEAGLPLPTELTGEPVSGFLIDEDERATRRKAMQKVCLTCHGTSWVEGHFARIDNTIETTNAMTRTATDLVMEAWSSGIAAGPGAGGSPFDETIERMWMDQWLFYANSTRFATAMAGADYGVFAEGRWYLSKNLREMRSWIDLEKEQ